MLVLDASVEIITILLLTQDNHYRGMLFNEVLPKLSRTLLICDELLLGTQTFCDLFTATSPSLFRDLTAIERLLASWRL